MTQARHMRARRYALLVAGTALTVAGCELLASPEPLRTQPAVPPGGSVVCMQALATGTLGADPRDPARVWLRGPDGQRDDLLWPAGFRVRFTPDAEVLAPTGEVVAREGEIIELGGGTVTDAFEICTINGEDWLTRR